MQRLQRLGAALRRVGAGAATLAPDALLLGGAAAISYGCGLAYLPAGFVIGGGFALAAGWMASRKGAA